MDSTGVGAVTWSLPCACGIDILGFMPNWGDHVPTSHFYLASFLFLSVIHFADELYGCFLPVPTGVYLVSHSAQLGF